MPKIDLASGVNGRGGRDRDGDDDDAVDADRRRAAAVQSHFEEAARGDPRSARWRDPYSLSTCRDADLVREERRARRNSKRRNLSVLARYGEDKVRATCKGPPVRTLADMSAADIAAIEATYGCRVLTVEERATRALKRLLPAPGTAIGAWRRRVRW